MVTGLGFQRFIQLLRGFTSTTTLARLEACEMCSDLYMEFSDREAAVIANVLTAVILMEPDATCLESELHSLSALVEWDLAPSYMFADLARLERQRLVGSQLEHFDFILSKLSND